jgi:hypothetical protein
VLKHSQHAELALLIDQGVVGDNRKIEVQGSGDSDGGDDVVLLDLVYDVHAVGHLPENSVNLIQVGLGCVRDKELAAAGILAGMRHGQGSCRVFVRIQVSLTLDLISGTAGTHPRVSNLLGERVTTLDHEVWDDPVEPGPVVKFTVRELLEIAYGARHLGIEQLGFDGAFARLYGCAFSH